MNTSQLTSKQKQFFQFIRSYKDSEGVWPTYKEIADHFGYKSPNSVTQNIQALVKKHYLVRKGDDYDLHPRLSAQLIRPSLDYDEQDQVGIPIKGTIAAGFLQEAVEANLGRITLEYLFPNLDKVFALRVSGNSMKDTGILDGDLVLLMDSDIRDGDIGAVLYDGKTSLKRIYMSRNGLRLEPANDDFDDIIIEPDIFEEVRVIGKYVGHVNRTGIHKAS